VRVGLLVCDHVRDELLPIAGDYPDMFAALFGGAVELCSYDVVSGELPASVAECDAWITTGSAASVYDPEPWIRRLGSFVVDVIGAQRPFVGICFGMQLMAQALGGEVAKAPQGWQVGVSHVTWTGPRPPWASPIPTDLKLLSSHRDQVVALPTRAEVLAGSPHCPVAVIAVGDHAIGFQGHPEFTAPYVAALCEGRRDRIGGDVVDIAIRSLDEATDASAVAAAIMAFIDAPG